MKKRLLASVLTFAMMLGCVMPVLAADEVQPDDASHENVVAEQPEVKTEPEALPGREIRFYAYVDDKLTLIETRSGVTTYWIGNRQCIKAETLETVYGKLGFRAGDLTAGSKLFLHTDLDDKTMWAESAKEENGMRYAAAINHKEVSPGGAPGDKFDVFYLPKQSVGNATNIENADTIAKETFYTVTDETQSVQYYAKGAAVTISKDVNDKIWSCVGADGNKIKGTQENGKITFTIPNISQAYTLKAEKRPAPQPVQITAKVNGTQVSGGSMENLIFESNLDAKDVKTLEFISGKLTKEDRAYIKENLIRLTDVTLNVSNSMILLADDGNPTTILGRDIAALRFGKHNGSSKGDLINLTLGGITEIRAGGIYSDSVENIDLPDVVTVGDSALSEMRWLESLNLPKAKTIGNSAFSGDDRLEHITFECVETLGDNAFYYTDSLRKLTLPATIKTIGNIKFGVNRNGNKGGSVITINALTPPEVASGAFVGVSSTSKESFVEVPYEALETYAHQENPSLDVSKPIDVRQMRWNELYLRAADTHVIKFYNSAKPWTTKYSFVKNGSALTAELIPGVEEKDNEMLLGWNTLLNGTGTMVKAGMVPTEDMTLYAIVVESVEITAQMDNEVLTFKAPKNAEIGDHLPTPPAKDEDHGFAGWIDQDGKAVTAETVFQKNASIYPTWFDDFNHNGVDDKTEPRFSVTYTDGVQGKVFADAVFGELLPGVQMPAFTGKTVRAGYVFAGWTPTLGETVTEDVVYTAIWKEDRNNNGIADDVDTYHQVIINDGMGGAMYEDLKLSVLTGTKFGGLCTDPACVGYVFKGWKDQDGKPVTDETVIDRDMVISAVFEKIEDEQTSTTPPAPTTPGTSSTPATGDGTHPMVWIVMMAAAAAVALTLTPKKQRK